MTIEEPQLLGAVVEIHDGLLFMRYDTSEEEFPWVGVRRERSGLWSWEGLSQLGPVLRYEGFKPRTKEPTLPCAVVRDEKGRLFVRSDETAQPWRLNTKDSNYITAVWFGWSDIPDPEVIFEGVAE